MSVTDMKLDDHEDDDQLVICANILRYPKMISVYTIGYYNYLRLDFSKVFAIMIWFLLVIVVNSRSYFPEAEWEKSCKRSMMCKSSILLFCKNLHLANKHYAC